MEQNKFYFKQQSSASANNKNKKENNYTSMSVPQITLNPSDMFKKIRPVKFLSALLLMAGIVFMASCHKSDLTAPDAKHPSSFTSLSGTNSPEIGSLQVFTLAGNGTPGLVNAQGTAAQFNSPSGTAVDAAGNVYVADKANHVIRKTTPSGVVTTLAGSGTAGYLDAQGSTAQFNNPSGVAVDGSGNVYVADAGNQVIRKVTAQGLVSTLAGMFNNPGSTNGPGSAAQFNNPLGVAVDASGNVLVADAGNHMIRRITPAGFVSLVAGTGTPGSGDGISSFSQFNNPSGVAVDISGNVYVADAGNNKIRKIAGFNVSTLAGSGAAGYTEGLGTAAQFNNPTGVAVDISGNVWVADKSNHAIRQVTASGVVSTLIGNGTAGFADGLVSVARFSSPAGIAIDASGKFFVADQSNYRVREIELIATVSTIAGSGSTGVFSGGYVDGDALLRAQFRSPAGIAISTLAYSAGNLLIADAGNNRIRNFSSSGDFFNAGPYVNTYAGSDAGYLDVGSAWYLTTVGEFNGPSDVAADASGNIYVADQGNHAIRKISDAGLRTFAGNGTPGFSDGQGSSARLNAPSGVATDNAGNVYVADGGNNRIRKITPAGVVTTLAGNGTAGYLDGEGANAQFKFPRDITVDASGNVYVADGGNNRIRKITPAGSVSTLAGDGTARYVDGLGTAAAFSTPTSVAVDAVGNVYVADQGNHCIRKITPAGAVSTVAGNGNYGYVDGSARVAQFTFPSAVAVGPSGVLYVADGWNNRIRKIQ